MLENDNNVYIWMTRKWKENEENDNHRENNDGEGNVIILISYIMWQAADVMAKTKKRR